MPSGKRYLHVDIAKAFQDTHRNHETSTSYPKSVNISQKYRDAELALQAAALGFPPPRPKTIIL
jgi:hypothetical protein